VLATTVSLILMLALVGIPSLISAALSGMGARILLLLRCSMSDSFVSVRDLFKTYKMGSTEVHALNGVSLEIEPATFTVLMGPSGSGKSTLLNMIGGLDWPTSGSILVDGEQIDRMDENQLANYRRNKLGFIFQTFQLDLRP